MMSLHRPLESLADRCAGNAYYLIRLERIGLYFLADSVAIQLVFPEFFQISVFAGDALLLEIALDGFDRLPGFPETELHRLVAVLFLCPDVDHDAGAGF